MLPSDIIANIEFYPTEQGGRSMPTPKNFFGCVFVIDHNNHDGRILLNSIGPIHPGDKKDNVPIKFLCADLVIPKLEVGTKFKIRDGKIIGEAEVVKIINTNPVPT